MREFRDKEHENLGMIAYRDLQEAEHTLNLRRPQTPRTAEIFIRNLKGRIAQYEALPVKWRKEHPFDTDSLLKRADEVYNALCFGR